ncbi:DUF4189 domain-containing protein [Noviherbaspirillum malthae]|uniref:DUF4189 domain-containing protein n=1 Tax=Noviherbaspirillum malthae TaxID=1260987 RepID=UPI0034DDC4AA
MSVGVTAALFSCSAFAWTATAKSRSTTETYTVFDADSPEVASEKAMQGCKRDYGRCDLMEHIVHGPVAVALITGQDTVFRYTNQDPEQAVKNGLQACRQQRLDCFVSGLTWDQGVKWISVAGFGSHKFVSTNFGTSADAQADALRSCRTDAKAGETCTIWHTESGAVWYAAASGRGASAYSLSFKSASDAAQTALRKCIELAKNATKHDCKVSHEVANSGPVLPPKRFAVLHTQMQHELARRAQTQKGQQTASEPREKIWRCTQDTNGLNDDGSVRYDRPRCRWEEPVYLEDLRN